MPFVVSLLPLRMDELRITHGLRMVNRLYVRAGRALFSRGVPYTKNIEALELKPNLSTGVPYDVVIVSQRG